MVLLTGVGRSGFRPDFRRWLVQPVVSFSTEFHSMAALYTSTFLPSMSPILSDTSIGENGKTSDFVLKVSCSSKGHSNRRILRLNRVCVCVCVCVEEQFWVNSTQLNRNNREKINGKFQKCPTFPMQNFSRVR